MVDIQRLRVQNARELAASGVSMILSKGRGGGKMRPLVCNQQTLESLTRCMRKRDQSSLLLFGSVSYVTLWRRLWWLSKVSNVEFDTHDLRRTFGHRHWKARTPIETIAKLIGHESVDTTFKTYIGVRQDEMLEVQRRCAPRR